MNRIVRTHYPAAKLPADLREGFAPGADVSVTVEEVVEPSRPLTLEEIMALRKPPFRTAAEIDRMIRSQRDEWDRE